MLLALIDAAGFRSAAKLSETEFAAALIAGLLPPAVGMVNGIPHWSKDQADSFLEYAEREVLQRHSHLANALISGASEVRSMQVAHAPIAVAPQAPTIERSISEPHDDERLNEEMAADYLGMSVEVLALARAGGTGPAWTRNGQGRIIYRFGDLRAFKAERDRVDTHTHTDRPNLDVAAAAAYCGYTVDTFKSFTKPSNRSYGKGPAFVKVRGTLGKRGGKVEFRQDDLDAWLKTHTKGAVRQTETKGRMQAPTEVAPKPKPDKRLTTKQVAKLAGVTIATLAWYRNQRTHNVAGHEHGPEFVRVGERGIYYMRSAVDAWLESRRRPPRKQSAATLATRSAALAKARAAKAAKRANRVTVGQGAIDAEAQARQSIVERIEACGKQADSFALNEALTHGKATIGQKVVLKAGTPHAHSRMPIVPDER